MNAPAPAQQQRPSLAAPVSQPPKARKIEKVADLFDNPQVRARLQEIAPRHLSPDRLLRVLAQACRTTPKLGQCDPMSLLGAIMTCAYLGLEPNTPLGHAYLIPFEKKRYNRETHEWETERVDVNLIIGYRGLIDLARRGGQMVSIHADVVYEGDQFSFEYGSNQHLRHVPMGGEEARKKPLWAYCHAKLQDGEAFEVLPYDLILRVRNSTQGYQAALKAKEESEKKGQEWRIRSYQDSPWVKYEHEMASKTMVRRLAKMLPMSIEYLNTMTLDGAGETGNVDFRRVAVFDGLFDPNAAITHSSEQPMDTTIDGAATDVTVDPEPVAASTKPAREEKPTASAATQPTESDAKPAEDAAKPAAAKPAAARKPKASTPPADDDVGGLDFSR